jgi:hypothetical protein
MTGTFYQPRNQLADPKSRRSIMKPPLAVTLMAAFLACGCGYVQDIQIADTRSNLGKLAIGMTRDQVVAIMGEPLSRETFGGSEYLLYRTEPRLNYYSSDSELTPVALLNSRVIGWGKAYLDNIAKSRAEAKAAVKQQ